MLDLKALLAKILSTFQGLVIRKTYTVSGRAFNTYYGTTSIDITLTGYTPIAIPRVALNQALLHCYLWQAIGNTAVIGVSRPTSSGTISQLSITIDVVYIKTSLIA